MSVADLANAVGIGVVPDANDSVLYAMGPWEDTVEQIRLLVL
jgi:hypothetical protein